jgi:hypothetical protein
MTAKYTVIENQTLSTSVSSVTMTGISGSYKDLVLIVGANTGASFAAFQLTLNGDTGSNYHRVFMRGDGSSATSGVTSGAARLETYGTVGDSVTQVDIMDYSKTDKHKSVLIAFANATNVVSRLAGRWADTSAITSLTVTGNYPAGSTFRLLGVN